MKFYACTLLIALMISTSAAQAQQVNFTTAKCQDLANMSEDVVDLVSVWLDGFSSDEEQPETLTVDFSGTDADDLTAYCQQNPSVSLVQAFENLE